MPSSRYDLIPTVLDLVTRMKPRTIIDVGAGVGKYGVLFREYLDVWRTDTPFNWNDDKSATVIIAVEACEEYKTPIWYVYDTIHINNILDIMDKLPEVDLLFMADVIEHFTKRDAQELLTTLQWKEAIITTPIEVHEQSAVYGNKYEQHVSEWTLKDFYQIGLTPIIHATAGNQQLIQLKK